MAPAPAHHPLATEDDARRRRAIAAHPSGTAVGRPVPHLQVVGAPPPVASPPTTRPPSRPHPTPVGAATRPATPVVPAITGGGEDGSMTTEYGLLVVVGATIVSLVLKWASGGAIAEILGQVVTAARDLVGF